LTSGNPASKEVARRKGDFLGLDVPHNQDKTLFSFSFHYLQMDQGQSTNGNSRIPILQDILIPLKIAPKYMAIAIHNTLKTCDNFLVSRKFFIGGQAHHSVLCPSKLHIFSLLILS